MEAKMRAIAAAMGPRYVLLVGFTLACFFAVAPRGGSLTAIMAAILIASLLSSIAGFAFSAICGAILFHLPLDHVQLVQIMITCSIASQAAMTWSMRRSIDWPRLSPFLIGSTLGLPLGIWLLLTADRLIYTRALGMFLLAYGGYMLMRRPLLLRGRHLLVDAATGFLGGITGGAVGFPGAFVTIWCGMRGWDKDRQRAIYQPFILITQVSALLAIAVARQAGGGYDPVDLIYIPAALLGTSLGMACFRRLNDRQFARAVNFLLILSGASYVVT